MRRERARKLGPVRFYPDVGCVAAGERVVALTVTESELLELLADAGDPPVTVRRETILYEMVIADGTLRTAVGNLRKKLGKEAIASSLRRGYRLQPWYICLPHER